MLDERAARLSGGVAIIQVGALPRLWVQGGTSLMSLPPFACTASSYKAALLPGELGRCL